MHSHPTVASTKHRGLALVFKTHTTDEQVKVQHTGLPVLHFHLTHEC